MAEVKNCLSYSGIKLELDALSWRPAHVLSLTISFYRNQFYFYYTMSSKALHNIVVLIPQTDKIGDVRH